MSHCLSHRVCAMDSNRPSTNPGFAERSRLGAASDPTEARVGRWKRVAEAWTRPRVGWGLADHGVSSCGDGAPSVASPDPSRLKGARRAYRANGGAQRAYTMRLNPPRLRMSTSMSRGDGGVAQEPFVVRDEIVRLGASCRRDHRVVQSFVEVMA